MIKRHYLFTFVLTLAGILPLQSQTIINSIISADETWTVSGSPYLLNANALIKQGVKVTIQPGVRVVSGNNKIIIDGELQANGKIDSVIILDSINFEFTAKANGYNFSTGAGSFFNYCMFNGIGLGGTITINLSPINMLIKNCKFYNCYYCIYGINANSDTATVKIQKTIFQGGKYAGYAIYPIGRYVVLEMDECLVKDMYGMYLANYTTITRSTFYNWMSYSGFRINAYSPLYYGRVVMACNNFTRFRHSVIEIMGVPTASTLVINNNTFDSAEVFIDMSLNSGSNKTKALYIHQNNFLTFTQKTLNLHGGNTPGSADTIDFTQNYWGGMTSSQIELSINDFVDDITVAGIADFSNGLANPVTDCVMQNPDFNSLSAPKMASETFKIFPNPASDICHIAMPKNGNYRLVISSVSGAVMVDQSFSGKTADIDLRRLAPGLYSIRISDGVTNYQNQKLMVGQ